MWCLYSYRACPVSCHQVADIVSRAPDQTQREEHGGVSRVQPEVPQPRLSQQTYDGKEVLGTELLLVGKGTIAVDSQDEAVSVNTKHWVGQTRDR